MSEHRTWEPKDFMFAGQRVILNPESQHFNILNRKAQNEAGYVIDHNTSKNDMEVILRSGNTHMPDWMTKVKWDNGEEQDIRMKDLLQVDAPIKPITIYTASSKISVFDDDEEAMAQVDRVVIKHGQRLRKVERFTQEIVDAFIKDAEESIGGRTQRIARSAPINIDEIFN